MNEPFGRPQEVDENVRRLINRNLNDKKGHMTILAVSHDIDVFAAGTYLDELAAWRGTIRPADCSTDCVVYRGFARSAEEVAAATQSAAKNALAAVAFARASTTSSQPLLEAAAVATSRPTDSPIDVLEIIDIGESRWTFEASYDFDIHDVGFQKAPWPHELAVTGNIFFPPHASGVGMQTGTVVRASSERSLARLMESVLWTDPAIRRALASGRKLLVKWGAGFFPGWTINKTALGVTKFAVWDAADDTVVPVGNVAAQAVLTLALRARNLSVRREGVITFARESPLILNVQSATLAAGSRASLLRGGEGTWRKHRAALNYLKRLGLKELAQEVAAQADAPARDRF